VRRDYLGELVRDEATAGDLEHRAVSIRSALICRAEEVAVGSEMRSEIGSAPLVPLKLTRVVGVLA
jgi:hypothetical protein